MRRIMSPTPQGTYKVSEELRNMWNDLNTRPKVIRIFAQCNYSPEAFMKRFSITSTKEREEEVHIPFVFVSEEEMATEYNLSQEDILELVTKAKEEQEFDLPVDEINMDMPSGSVLERAEDRSLDDGNAKRAKKLEDPEVKQAMEKESLKILKRMAFPNMDKIESAGANLPKLVSCISTRMVILEEAKALLQIHVTKKMEKLKADQATSETITKTGSVKTMERMMERLSTTYDAMDTCCEEFSDLHTRGIVDGWDEIQLEMSVAINKIKKMVDSWELDNRARTLVPSEEQEEEPEPKPKTKAKAKAKRPPVLASGTQSSKKPRK
ncbi:hypothetical protein AK812_SmicGene13537 [Symbiodinium microadriaticum]|uniref:Uncharacterized protein n=1 Tax=Symbiodinium microadriaticum TaxID=2951 RepID=A0A1Q9E7X4_SYMMI|nr:hypothetical protein AK812_SmicGene13537 [Symbiodinium microadriaticum]